MMMSPTLMPIRKSIRSSGALPELRSAMPRCTSTAQRTASTTLGLDDPAPVLRDLPVDELPPVRLQFRQSGAVVAAHEARIARHIGAYDRRQSPLIPRHSKIPLARPSSPYSIVYSEVCSVARPTVQRQRGAGMR